MAKGKKKKLKALGIGKLPDEEEEAKKVPIDNLPDNYLWMHVKHGTKIRNVLEYALKHFPERGSIVWSGVGKSINKTMSCSQLFKSKHSGLHQVTRLQAIDKSVKSTKPSEGSDDKKIKNHVLEIHIFLSKSPTHAGELGYQGPEDAGEFVDPENPDEPARANNRPSTPAGSSGKVTSLAAEEFAAMGLRTGQKRTRRDQQNDTPVVKRNRKKENASN